MATLQNIVRDPSVPYLALIPGGLQHGRMIRINGRMLEHDRFAVNIQSSPAISPLDEVNLHLSIRPNEGVIVRNHFTRHIWGPEERIGVCPIQYNSPFELLILAEHDKFKIAVNGRHFGEFHHRLPLSKATYFYINGRVIVNSILLEGDRPSAPPLSAMTSAVPSYQQPYHPSHYQPTPPYQQRPYQPPPCQPMQQHIHHQSHTPSSITTTTYAAPTNHTAAYQGSYGSCIQYPTQNPTLNPTHYPTQHPTSTISVTDPNRSNSGTTALKVAAGIGGIGLGAYALSKIFDHSDSD